MPNQRVKNSLSGVAFDLPKEVWEKIKETDAATALTEVSKTETSTDDVPGVVAEKITK